MALSNAFYEAVNSGNIRRVRIMMKDSLLLDPTFSRFKEMENKSQNLIGLYEKHNGKTFILDSSKWDDNYMDKLMVEVLMNFSHERIEHLKDVVQYLRPTENKIHTKTTPEHNQDKNHSFEDIPCRKPKSNNQQNSDYRIIKVGVAAGIVAGGIAGGVIASACNTSIVGGIAGGAVAGGIIGGIVSAGIKHGG